MNEGKIETSRNQENIVSPEALEAINDILLIIHTISNILGVLSKSDFRINMLKMLAENILKDKIPPEEALRNVGEILCLSREVN